MWLGRKLKALGISKERAKLLSVTVVKVRGIKFIIRRLNPIDYANVRFEPFMATRGADQYDTDKALEAEAKEKLRDPEKISEVINDIKKQYTPVLLKGIIWPKISPEETEDAICVGDFFEEADFDTANKLYGAIMELSSKKKTLFILALKKLSSLISLPSGMASSPAK